MYSHVDFNGDRITAPIVRFHMDKSINHWHMITVKILDIKGGISRNIVIWAYQNEIYCPD